MLGVNSGLRAIGNLRHAGSPRYAAVDSTGDGRRHGGRSDGRTDAFTGGDPARDRPAPGVRPVA